MQHGTYIRQGAEVMNTVRVLVHSSPRQNGPPYCIASVLYGHKGDWEGRAGKKKKEKWEGEETQGKGFLLSPMKCRIHSFLPSCMQL